MTASAGTMAAAGPPPPDAATLLAQVAPERQKLFALVRELLVELDTAAPWDDLYYPTDVAEVFLARLRALFELVELIPGRIHELVELLTLASLDDETRATLEEAEFYFSGIHSMCARDLERLRQRLEPLLDPTGSEPLCPRERNFLCELAADLKGKYTSALMGATASVVAEGLWSSLEVEAVLFPEKAEEARRNQALVAALRRTLGAIDELREQVPLEELVGRWRSGTRVDPYALADLATFRGVLGQLLKRQLRRGLYSGDYHQIQHREVSLATRIAALEQAHHRTWAEAVESEEAAAATYRELVQLALEVAALLDVELLERLLGAKAVKDVRAAATAERAAERGTERATEGTKSRRRRLSDELDPLVALLAQEDLKSFLDLLLGSVLKRASLAAARQATSPAEPAAPTPSPPAEPRLDDTLALRFAPVITPPLSAEVPAASRAAGAERNAPAAPAPAASPPPPAAALRATPPAPPPPAAGAREVLANLHQRLTALQSNENNAWSGFRMLQRLLERHSRIPPSMVQGAHPFLFAVLNELVPELEVAAGQGLVPAEARARLVDCCLALSRDDLSPEQMDLEVPAHLRRLQRLLQGLTAATAAQLEAGR